MSFKTDTIKLKRYTSEPTGAEGVIALVGASSGNARVKYYDGSWKGIDSTPSNSNTIMSTPWNASLTLTKNIDVESLVYYNLTDSTGYTLKVPPVGNYGAHAQVQVINGSDKTLNIAREDAGADELFWWRGSDPSARVATIEIGPSQRALFLKTSAAYWEVIVLTL
mgnify:CR=1 FL=1